MRFRLRVPPVSVRMLMALTALAALPLGVARWWDESQKAAECRDRAAWYRDRAVSTWVQAAEPGLTKQEAALRLQRAEENERIAFRFADVAAHPWLPYPDAARR